MFYLVKNKNERENKKYLCKLLSLSAAVGWLFPESYSEPVPQKPLLPAFNEETEKHFRVVAACRCGRLGRGGGSALFQSSVQ